MPHFVRCIDGHVFDAETSPQCPTCGATVDMPPPRTPSPTASPSADANEDHSIAAAAGTQNEAAATPGIGARLAHSAVRIVLVGSMVGVVGGVFVYGALPRLWLVAAIKSARCLRALRYWHADGNCNGTVAAPIPQIDISDAIASAAQSGAAERTLWPA